MKYVLALLLVFVGCTESRPVVPKQAHPQRKKCKILHQARNEHCVMVVGRGCWKPHRITISFLLILDLRKANRALVQSKLEHCTILSRSVLLPGTTLVYLMVNIVGSYPVYTFGVLPKP